MCAAVPRDISILVEQSISASPFLADCEPNNNGFAKNMIECYGADGLTLTITNDDLVKYLSNTEYTKYDTITYRGMKICTWFNSTSGIFEGQINFMNHQLDILSKLDHSLFDNIYYQYFRQKNDITLNEILKDNSNNTDKNNEKKTFKLRYYVREMLIQSVDKILAILQCLPVDDQQFMLIASHFQNNTGVQ